MRERLVDEASARVAEQGVDALSVRTLAAGVGTSTAAIYTLFGGKPGVFAAMHERAFRRLDAAADTFLPLLEAVRRCVEGGRFRADVPAESVATALWANVHGLVSLELRQITPPQAGDPAKVFETAVRATVRGWAAAST